MSKPIATKKESKVLSLRVSPDLLEQIETRAAIASGGNVSAYLLGLVAKDADQPAPEPPITRSELREAITAAIAPLTAEVDAVKKLSSV